MKLLKSGDRYTMHTEYESWVLDIPKKRLERYPLTPDLHRQDSVVVLEEQPEDVQTIIGALIS